MQWGILDTRDNLWLGDDNGPRMFDNEMLARCAAQIWEDQVLGTDLGGVFQVREIHDREWRIRDELEVKRTGLESLRRIEGDVE